MLKKIKVLFAEKSVRLYLRFFGIGMGISFATLILNSSFQVMGVDLSEFKSLFVSLLPLFLKDYIQTLFTSGVLFGAIGLLLSSAFWREDQKETQKNEIQKQKEIQSKIGDIGEKRTLDREHKRSGSFKKELLIFGIFIFLLWCHSVIFYPQLYGEFFFYRFPFLRFFLFFLTDWIRPEVPQFLALATLALCIGARCVFLISDRVWSKLLTFLFFCFFLFYAHLSGSSLGIFIITLEYLTTFIFYKQIVPPGGDVEVAKRNRIRLVLLFIFCLFSIYFYSLGSLFGILIVSFACLATLLFQNTKSLIFASGIVALFSIFPFWNAKKETSPNSFPIVSFLNVKTRTKTNVPENLPNILILSADSLRADRMGYAQGKKGLTPHIDSLSKDSIIFQDHHTTIPRTFPAWADLLTGQPGFVHGIQDMFPDAKDRGGLTGNHSKTLPALLSKLGYRTNVVSSFAGDIFPRADWGFQSVKAPIFHAGTLTAQRILESQIFLLPILTGSIPGAGEYFRVIRGFPSLGDDSKILPDLFGDLKKDKNPFFTVFFSSVTHFPFSPPFPFYKKFTNSEYYGNFKYFKFVDPSDSSELARADQEQIRGLFQASIASFDESVGAIVHKLKEEGTYDSTLIVLTSDHGESLFEADHSHGHGEHLRGEGVTRIPLLIKFPQNAGAGRKFGGISSSLDLFPTLLTFVSEKIRDVSLRKNFLNELTNRSGRDLSFALNSATWKDSRNVYGETGIWFSDLGNHFFQKERIFYPNILHLHSIEPGEIPWIVIGDSYAKESVIVSKHRMFQNGTRKLIYIPSEDGVRWRCYDRIADPWNTKPLSISECSSLKDSLVSFLTSSGKFKKAGEYLFPLSN
ncbi:arylsulfatase [Leptospira weilii serovar Ranarum str. ICFT]|uniref:Arylsulfatase n=1 Tax=Leptospira weilii serovar Ranarum str. ICFT TaxID=1218598 RepID=N1WET8_9LEPT|nr:sulfatase-like hydrolase/transferase [Leptospira weilii]EMY78766.1 arylsulfatase [Leptospira weilii serovar Ranarum str. ICFT]